MAIAAVVEREDVEADVVEAGEGWDRVCKRAVGSGEEEDRGVIIRGAGC